MRPEAFVSALQSGNHVVLFYPLPNAKSDFSQISSGVTNFHESAGRTKVCEALLLLPSARGL